MELLVCEDVSLLLGEQIDVVAVESLEVRLVARQRGVVEGRGGARGCGAFSAFEVAVAAVEQVSRGEQLAHALRVAFEFARPLHTSSTEEQIEEETLARNILDKLKLVGNDNGALYMFDRDLQSISAAAAAPAK